MLLTFFLVTQDLATQPQLNSKLSDHFNTLNTRKVRVCKLV